MGFFSSISSSSPSARIVPAVIQSDERTYTRRQRLHRTISAHTLTLIQTWFHVLPVDSSGKVLLSLLLQRLEALGFSDLMTHHHWNPDDSVTLDSFLDLIAKSGLVENYRDIKSAGSGCGRFLRIPLPNETTIEEESAPSSPVPPLETPRPRYRTASVLDMLRDSVGGGIQKVGCVKVHPRPLVVSRKETPPLYANRGFSRLRRLSQVKVLGFLR
jgi:hypothetical protein